MRIMRKRAVVTTMVAAALVLSACGSSDDDGGGGDEPKLDNGAIDTVVDESDEKGGTLKFGLAGEWGDRCDPGDTYYGYSWDLLRNYARTLVMFKTEPGKAGLELTPDTRPGPRQAHRRRQDLDLHDPGRPEVRGRLADHRQDIKYAVAAHLRQDDLPQRLRPTSRTCSTWPKGYDGPYQDAGHEHRLGDRDPGRHHDRLPPQAAVRRRSTTWPSCRRRHRSRRPRTPARSTRTT